MLALRSFLFHVGIILMLILFLPIVLISFVVSYPIRYWLLIQYGKFLLWWLKITCNLTYHVEGLENIKNQPAVILSKHQSAWETFALQRVFSYQVWVLKRELLRIPIFGWGLKSLKVIAIDRGSKQQAIKQIIEQGKDRLDKGINVIVFPEGTRVAPNQTRRYAIGGALLAVESGYPVIPVAHNAGEFWGRTSFLRHPGCIQVRIGKPIDTKGKTPNEVNELTREWIEGQMQTLTVSV